MYYKLEDALDSKVDKLRKFHRLLIDSFMGGILVAFGATLSIVASIYFNMSPRLAASAVFPIGLILITFLGSELFTGDCLIVCTEGSWMSTFYFLTVVYIGNLIGSYSFAGILSFFLQSDSELVIRVLSTCNYKLGSFNDAHLWFVFTAVLCNMLVGHAVAGAASSTGVMDKIARIWFPIFLFVFFKFEHCVANMFYFSLAYFNGFSFGDDGLVFWYFGLISLLNFIGALIYISCLYAFGDDE